MKIILTGSTGFIGRNLLSFLVGSGHQLENVSLRNAWKLPMEGDALIHLAGKAHDIAESALDEEYYRVNTDLTTKLFDDFLGTNIRDFFYFSSVKAAADSVDDLLIEDVIPKPDTVYGKSKLKSEQYLLSQNLPFGKRLFIIRPCMIHGPGNKGNLNLLYKVVEKGIPWPLASFVNKRSFLSIDNLNFLLLTMLQNDKILSGIYNFADDQPISTNELVRIIAKTSRKKERFLKIPTNVIITVAKVGDILKLPLNSERLKKLTESYVVSNAKIKAELSIEHLPFSAEEGLIKTIKSFQK